MFLLDTNAVIHFLNGRPASVRAKVSLQLQATTIYLSSIVLFELWYGASKSQRYGFNAERLADLMRGEFELAPFDETDARVAGEVRAALEARGTPIGSYDILIAAQALRRGAILVTANSREFGRIDGLVCEDWTSP